MTKITAAISAVGKYVPDFVLSNALLETMVDTNDEWITSRTGIKERRILKGENKGTSYMAIKAAQDLLRKKQIPYHKIAGKIRFTNDDLFALIESSAVTSCCATN